MYNNFLQPITKFNSCLLKPSYMLNLSQKHVFREFPFLVKRQSHKSQKKSRGRYSPRCHQVLSQFEISLLLLVNYLEKEEAFKNKERHHVIDWMVINTSLWGFRIAESANLLCGHIHQYTLCEKNSPVLPQSAVDVVEKFETQNKKEFADILRSTLLSLMIQDNQKMPAHIGLKNTKGNIPRDVPIFGWSAQFILREYLQWKKFAGESTDADAPFFFSPRSKNGRYTTQGLRKCFRRAKVKAGIIKPITPHCGRHTMGSHMTQESKYLQEVKSALGHASISTTNQYSHMFSPKMCEFSREYERILYNPIMTNILKAKSKEIDKTSRK
ncbi:tyrosine-type recombinase/integrase [Candidatus Uabimicrobium sp. HlEnr_7]|uniref:tyrosine-type recombinase/integrase n=1 Tax=Candidatus Uabimicrobium helgolandensis TaxID=3095367 RepID=UPI0035570AF8